jgi:hypothetical protein
MSKSQATVTATLVRGEDYTLNVRGGDALVFRRGVPVEVTADQRAHLEANAVDFVTMPARTDDEECENRAYPKFQFEEVLR